MWLANGRRPDQSGDEWDISVMELLAAFWAFAQSWYVKNGKPTNEIDAYRLVIRDIKNLHGSLPAIEFGPIAFRAVRQAWIDRGMARSSVNKNAGRLKRIFKWGVSQELIPPSVHQALMTVDGLRRGRCGVREAPPVLPVPMDVIEATIPYLTPVLADMVRFQLARSRRLTDAQRAELLAWQKEHRWHPNQLRHTRETDIRKRFGLEAAQVILGHAAADVTQVYAERDREKAIEVARQVG